MQRRDETNQETGRGRSVSEILERRQRQMEETRRMLPPDFVHGDTPVGEIYEVLGRRWAERALFGVDDGDVVTLAYYDDYFLAVEHWTGDDQPCWSEWWSTRREGRDLVVVLDVETGDRLAGEATVPIDIDRRRLHELERGVLGVVRDGMTGDETRRRRLRRGEVDVLSLVTLTSRLVDDDRP